MIRNSSAFNDPITLTATIIGSFALVVTPSILMWVAIVFAIFLDTILGLIRVVTLKEKWEWSKFWGVLVKFIVYSGIFFVVFLLDTIFLKDFISKLIDIEYVLAKWCGIFIVARELYSIDNSVRAMNNDKGFKFYFKRMISNMSSYKDDIKSIKDDFKDMKK